MPDLRTYEIEVGRVCSNVVSTIVFLRLCSLELGQVMFWGLRECRSINFQSIQQAEVSIECAGARITKTIEDVQKHPNFELSNNESEKYRLRVVSYQSFSEINRTERSSFVLFQRICLETRTSGRI